MDDEMDFEGAIAPPQPPQPTPIYPQAEPTPPASTSSTSDSNAKMLCVCIWITCQICVSDMLHGQRPSLHSGEG